MYIYCFKQFLILTRFDIELLYRYIYVCIRGLNYYQIYFAYYELPKLAIKFNGNFYNTIDRFVTIYCFSFFFFFEQKRDLNIKY